MKIFFFVQCLFYMEDFVLRWLQNWESTWILQIFCLGLCVWGDFLMVKSTAGFQQVVKKYWFNISFIWVIVQENEEKIIDRDFALLFKLKINFWRDGKSIYNNIII